MQSIVALLYAARGQNWVPFYCHKMILKSYTLVIEDKNCMQH